MGCGLRKLEEQDDSSPGKIFSTLKRPQVETKTDSAYEYVLLDFTLEASSNPEVIKISSVLDIATKVEEYYIKGYVVGAIHPIILPIGRRKHFSASYLYRVVLSRLKLSQKHTAPRRQRHPRLVIEECPLTYETLTNEVVKGLLEKVNEAAKRGKKFVGFITQHFPQPKFCNGTNTDGNVDSESALFIRSREHRKYNYDENYKNWNEGTLFHSQMTDHSEEEIQPERGQLQDTDFQFGKEGSSSPTKSRKEDNKLYTIFNVFDDDSTCWTYHEGVLSMKITRKGPVVSTLDADWLELTTFYYKQGLSLIDTFVHWETSKGDHIPKSLEGLFIYEEEGSGVPGSNRKGNDTIVVEQWTVIEGCEIKTDYGPLLHTLAEFGWLLTCVLPTPIIRHDSLCFTSWSIPASPWKERTHGSHNWRYAWGLDLSLFKSTERETLIDFGRFELDVDGIFQELLQTNGLVPMKEIWPQSKLFSFRDLSCGIQPSRLQRRNPQGNSEVMRKAKFLVEVLD
nr:raftlin-2 isoform X2 [Pelodiscus sinensis]|eukprot:XP_025037822.1 raftlin-2 isoform X2 [Pelodiscus sinensis]